MLDSSNERWPRANGRDVETRWILVGGWDERWLEVITYQREVGGEKRALSNRNRSRISREGIGRR